MLTITPNSNTQVGNHTISVVYNDGISVPSTSTFIFETVLNSPLLVLIPPNNQGAIANNLFMFTLDKD